MPGDVAYVRDFPICNFCGQEAHYDARTKQGPWANMCDECFKMYGRGLGPGRGQKLLISKSAFIECVEGALSGKTDDEAFQAATTFCSIKTVRITPQGLHDAIVGEGWNPNCPYCGSPTPVEPDADYVYCQDCNQRFKIINPYF